MANTIRIKRSSVASNVPTAGELLEGELAINTNDQRLWSKDASTVFELTDHDNLTNYVANEHIDWTSASSAFSTTGTAATGALTVTGDVQLNAVTGDRLAIYNGLDTTSMYGFGIESSTLYYKSNGNHRWYIGTNADAGTSDYMNLDTTDLTVNANVVAEGHNIRCRSGGELLVNTDDNAATSFRVQGATASGNLTTINTTGDLQILGPAEFTVVNYSFDVDQTVGAGQDNYVLTYDNADGQISLEAAQTGLQASDTATITGTWTFDGVVTTSDYGTGGRVKDGTDVSRPMGFNVMPVYEIDANDTFDLAHNGMLWHKDSGVAVTFSCPNDTTIPQGATYAVANEDTEDVTISPNTGVTLLWLEAGAAPASGSFTISQGGIVTVYKYSDTEWWAWGSKEAGSGGISSVVADTTPQLGGTLDSNGNDIWMKDNDQIQFGSASGGDAIMYFDGVDDLRIDLDDSQNFRIRGGTSGTEAMLNALANGEVGIYYNGSLKLSTTNTGVNVTGTVDCDGASMDDNDNLYFGTGNDWRFYFNATDLVLESEVSGSDFLIQGGSTGTEAMIRCNGNGSIQMYYNGIQAFETQQYNLNEVTSGARVVSHDGVFKDVGFNELVTESEDVSDTLEAKHCGGLYLKDGTTAITITLPSTSSAGTDFPVFGVVTVVNAATSGNITINASTNSRTLYWLDDGTRTGGASTNRTLGPAGVATIWRESSTIYYIWGSSLS